MTYKYIEYRKKDRIATITLNRADKRNALNAQMVEELKIAFDLAEQDKQVKVIVLKANGKAFSAGADLEYLQKLQQNSYEDNLHDSQDLMELFLKIYTHKKVVIAQIEGHAIAGGCGLATVCDFVFAIPEAKFGYTEVKIGFIPAIVMVFLLRKIGEAKAKELLFTGDLITAEEACNAGLIQYVEFSQDIADSVSEFARKLCEKTSGVSLEFTKKMISKVPELTLMEALHYAAKCNARARDTEDCKIGISAFLNKKELEW